MVELTLGEIIQIYRKRAGINQGQLGADEFQTTPESGRPKIKNIELNKQKPTLDDLKAIAHTLSLPLADFLFYQTEPPKTAVRRTRTVSMSIAEYSNISKGWKSP